jgi:hypothetical protein
MSNGDNRVLIYQDKAQQMLRRTFLAALTLQ